MKEGMYLTDVYGTWIVTVCGGTWEGKGLHWVLSVVLDSPGEWSWVQLERGQEQDPIRGRVSGEKAWEAHEISLGHVDFEMSEGESRGNI